MSARKTLITGATLVNEGKRQNVDLLTENGLIAKIDRAGQLAADSDTTVLNAAGCLLLPGVIDEHVHSRDPGLTYKGDLDTESKAAAAGGVTSIFDMPNVVPQTTSLSLLKERYGLAAQKCHVNYAFYLGATNDNLADISRIDTRHVPGVKLFMGSSTGNMLVDGEDTLRSIFEASPSVLVAHCEDTRHIAERMKETTAVYGDDPDVRHHPEIRDEEACARSSALAIKLAEETVQRLHVAHVTTKRELEMISVSPFVTAEVCVAHLLFSDDDYSTLGTRMKCNPAVKTCEDRDALRRACNDGTVYTIATDHAPHLLKEKEGGCVRAASGMPMVQFSLPCMLTLSDEGVLSIEKVVELMCHNPAELFGVKGRGYVREGYHADLVLVSHTPFTVTKECILSKCGWSPLEGRTLNWKVEHTFVNGNHVWNGTDVDGSVRGMAVAFHGTGNDKTDKTVCPDDFIFE